MESLKNSKEFGRVYQQGKSKATRDLVLYVLKNSLDNNRYGFSISKKIGNAVVRNKLKRRLKEIIREKDEKLKKGYDLIIIARKPVTKLDYLALKKDVERLFKKMEMKKIEENNTHLN